MIEHYRLRQLCRSHMKEAKRELERTQNLRPVFRAYYENARHYDFQMPEGTEHIMNHGRAKEVLFDFLRKHTTKTNVLAWVFVTDIFYAQSTPEGVKAGFEEMRKHQDRGFETLKRLGWVTVEESLLITAQNADEVILYTQPYSRKPEINWLGPAHEKCMAQADFGGRQKMFGATTSDVVGNDPSRDTSGPVGLDLMNTMDPL